MQRHWHQQVDIVRQMPLHQPRRSARVGSAPAVLQPQRERARHHAVTHRRAHARMSWRVLQASGAVRVLAALVIERHVAARAPRRPQEPERSPAACAEAVITLHDRTASRAPRRQREIAREGQRGSDGVHRLLSPVAAHDTSRAAMTPPDIFDRHARRRQRDRASSRFAAHDFLRAAMLDGIADRLASVKRTFADVLDLGCFDSALPCPPGARILRADPGHTFAAGAGGVQADEDRLPFAPGTFDLVVSAGTLDTVNDLPGALTLIRRALRPDGLFLGAFLGGNTLETLRATFRAVEAERPVPRVHPQVEVRAAGDLLLRAGFALPVADVERLDVRYAGLGRLLDDLRGSANANVLADRQPLRRDTLASAAAEFARRAAPDGRTAERFDILFVTGWAPSPDQPQPARRGSATTSLAAALRVSTVD